MYSMDNLLTLIHTEQARGLKIRPGFAPIIEVGNGRNQLEGPTVTAEMARMLLRSIASSRQMRELERRGEVAFIYTLPGMSSFFVRAKMEEDNVVFVIQ